VQCILTALLNSQYSKELRVELRTLTVVLVVAGLLAVCTPLLAHHGAAAYDMTKAVMLKDAVVTKYSWMNPHVLIYFDLKDSTGKVTQWTVETGSPSAIGVVGWGRNSVKIGDAVTLWIFQTKTGLPVGRLNKIQFADGSMLRDSQVGGENGERTDDGLR
jgi:hypothetical protein